MIPILSAASIQQKLYYMKEKMSPPRLASHLLHCKSTLERTNVLFFPFFLEQTSFFPFFFRTYHCSLFSFFRIHYSWVPLNLAQLFRIPRYFELKTIFLGFIIQSFTIRYFKLYELLTFLSKLRVLSLRRPDTT